MVQDYSPTDSDSKSLGYRRQGGGWAREGRGNQAVVGGVKELAVGGSHQTLLPPPPLSLWALGCEERARRRSGPPFSLPFGLSPVWSGEVEVDHRK